jgi:ketosteroid isomerase-like protein
MASPRVERLEQCWAHVNAGDIEQALEFTDPAIVWQPPAAFPGARRLEGRDEVIAFFEPALRAVAGFRIEAERYIERGDDVLVIQQHYMRGPESGIETTRRMAQLWHFDGDRAVAMDSFHDVDEALAELDRRASGRSTPAG